VDREARQDLRKGLKRPQEAFREAEARLILESPTPADQLDAEEAFPDFKKIRRSYSRHSSKSCPVVPSWVAIPAELRTTFRGRNPTPGAEWAAEPFVIFPPPNYVPAENEQRLIVFADKLQLSVLRSASHIVGDGNFKFQPDGWRQLYTLHTFARG
jgi:hypothetical protein